MAPSRGGIVVFSGGSAANSLVDVFELVRKSRSCSLSYIIPISDNGGSTSELIRVFGGPGIGDVRSRLVRLIPQQPYSREREAIGTLLSHRLSGSDSRDARNDWSDIVDGTSALWKSIPSAKKELIRSFFNVVNLEILKRSRPPTSTFDFRSASVGNLFLTGARLFSGSFESAIYLLSAVCGIPDEEIKVIPSINSNFSHHIAAELEDGTVIVGQNSISHPSSTVDKSRDASILARERARMGSYAGMDSPMNVMTNDVVTSSFTNGFEEPETQEVEDAHPPFTLPTLRASNILFTKAADELDDLPSRISRVHYVNTFGQEILPPANPRAIQALQSAKTIIYSIGSLYTSIVPSLVLRGIGNAMRRSHASEKVLILNGCLDREAAPGPEGQIFTAVDFINAIVKAGEQSRGVVWSPRSGLQRIDIAEQAAQIMSNDLGKRPSFQRARSQGYSLAINGQQPGTRRLPEPMLASAMPSRTPSPDPLHPLTPRLDSLTVATHSSSKPDPVYRHYVTHLVHLPNSEGTPYVDQELLATKYGIKCIRVYGRRNNSGAGMLYDGKALQGAIEAVLGGRTHGGVNAETGENASRARPNERERGRRNTVER